MTFRPHTLEEQKALLTAEAEGRVIRYSDTGNPKGVGLWRFSAIRYEVEQPLMEEWTVLDRNDAKHGRFSSESDAKGYIALMLRPDGDHGNAPFRVVHMREVRATQGPTP